MKSSKNDILAVQLQASLPFMFPCQAFRSGNHCDVAVPWHAFRLRFGPHTPLAWLHIAVFSPPGIDGPGFRRVWGHDLRLIGITIYTPREDGEKTREKRSKNLLFGWPFLSWCWVLGFQYSNVGGRISMCMHVLLAKDLIWHGFFAPVRAKARTQGNFLGTVLKCILIWSNSFLLQWFLESKCPLLQVYSQQQNTSPGSCHPKKYLLSHHLQFSQAPCVPTSLQLSLVEVQTVQLPIWWRPDDPAMIPSASQLDLIPGSMGKVSQLNSNKENSQKEWVNFTPTNFWNKYIQTQQQAMFFRPFNKKSVLVVAPSLSLGSILHFGHHHTTDDNLTSGSHP